MGNVLKSNIEFNNDKSWARKCQDEVQAILGEGNYEDISDKREVGDIIVCGNCRVELKFDRYPTTGNWALEEKSNNKPGWAVTLCNDPELVLWYIFVNKNNRLERGYHLKYDEGVNWFNIVKDGYPSHRTRTIYSALVRLVPEKDILANIKCTDLTGMFKRHYAKLD
jgi:hypothetical protein